jgi:hypothetical protein
VWYSEFLKTALRKHNLRVDMRVYIGDELEPSTQQDIEAKIKSILSSAIIKGLDVIGLVSRFGVEPGMVAKQQAINNKIDLKVIPGQDYVSSEKIKAVFYNIQKNIPPGLGIQDAIKQAKAQGGKVMLYDLSRSTARAIASWQSTPYEPDFVEIYNAHSKAYKDLDIDYPRVLSTAARSGSELEDIPVYTEIPRNKLSSYGLLEEEEGENYTPGYLQNVEGEMNG